MLKEKARVATGYGYINAKSNAISANKSILERATLYNGSARTGVVSNANKKMEKKNCGKK